jgi:hypothetical protein
VKLSQKKKKRKRKKEKKETVSVLNMNRLFPSHYSLGNTVKHSCFTVLMYTAFTLYYKLSRGNLKYMEGCA